MDSKKSRPFIPALYSWNPAWAVVLALAIGCSQPEPLLQNDPLSAAPEADARRFAGPTFAIGDELVRVRPDPNPERNAYFGDLHVHTK